ncbi:hypothetical protein BE221DRAFT_75338 [Ostreococcus tauri]|uniref:Uncharacterized protein n=1 Tax=Ostreococcus tauri TaxID=70448 RepID=A0A1Y5IDL7_OSTTA|nr:hypothetical protein BE221DRAFT_75338 [Ostreococcus tauri]
MIRTSVSPRVASTRASKRDAPREIRKRPTLFLDVDGVLNRTATAKQIVVLEDKVELLGDILARSECEIVLTTYWRYFEEYVAYVFARHGLPDRVVGRTSGEPHRADSVAHDASVSTNRVLEIERYLKATHGEDASAWPEFAIVDDKEVVSDGHAWRRRFVRTTHDVGLTPESADALVDILKGAEVMSRV